MSREIIRCRRIKTGAHGTRENRPACKTAWFILKKEINRESSRAEAA